MSDIAKTHLHRVELTLFWFKSKITYFKMKRIQGRGILKIKINFLKSYRSLKIVLISK